MSLYHHYRPKTLDEFVGNVTMVATLRADLVKRDRPHAFLFHGPVGCGKTTLARIVGKELGCVGHDFHEINTADFRGIDTARDIIWQSRFKALGGQNRTWFIDECHKLTNDAQHALLKALEDPPGHVYYILATTEPQKLLRTMKSRCSQYQVGPLTEGQMYRLLNRIAHNEKEKLQGEVCDQIVRDSECHPRLALQILDQVLGVPAEQRLVVARRQAELQVKTIHLCRVLLHSGTPWKKVARILEGLKEQEPEKVRRAVLGYCSAILLRGQNDQAAGVMSEMLEPFHDVGFPGLVFSCYSIARGRSSDET